MKKLIATLLALLLALSGMAALAEGVTVTGTLSIDQEAALNALSLTGLDEDQLNLAATVLPLLNGLGGRLTVVDGGAQLDASLNGKDVLNLAGALGEEGVTLVSNLFPNYALTLAPETLESLINQMGGQLKGVDLTAALESVSGYFSDYIEVCIQSVSLGEPETGSYEFEGVAFNTKVPVNVDMEAIMAAAQTFVNQLANDEAVQSAVESLQAAGVDIDITEAQTAESIPADEIPEITVTAYMNVDEAGNEGEDAYVTVEVAKQGEDEPVTLTNVLVTGGRVKVDVIIPEEETTVTVTVTPADSGADVRMDVNAEGGVYFGMAANVNVADDVTVDAAVYFLDAVNPLISGHITVTEGGALTLPATAEGKSVLAVETLMGDNAEEASSGLIMDVVLYGLGNVLSAATEAMPEAVGNLMNQFGLTDIAA